MLQLGNQYPASELSSSGTFPVLLLSQGFMV